MALTMVNARVDEVAVGQARNVLKAKGLTLSHAIRTTVEYIARTGKLPVEDNDQVVDAVARVDEATSFFEALPVSEPPAGWGDIDLDRRIVHEERGRDDTQAHAAG